MFNFQQLATVIILPDPNEMMCSSWWWSLLRSLHLRYTLGMRWSVTPKLCFQFLYFSIVQLQFFHKLNISTESIQDCFFQISTPLKIASFRLRLHSILLLSDLDSIQYCFNQTQTIHLTTLFTAVCPGLLAGKLGGC